MTTYPPIPELIPHSGPMVLLDEMTDWSPQSARCRARIRPRGPFVVFGQVDVSVTIEYMAQAVAACLGHKALIGGEGVRAGMVVACKVFSAHRDCLRVGDELQVLAEQVSGNDTMSHFSCRVEQAGTLVSEAVLTLFHAEQLPSD